MQDHNILFDYDILAYEIESYISPATKNKLFLLSNAKIIFLLLLMEID
jgi:hypothetical protein